MGYETLDNLSYQIPTYIFFHRVSPELAAKHLEYLLADPAALGERGEGEVVGVHLAQACKCTEQTKMHILGTT